MRRRKSGGVLQVSSVDRAELEEILGVARTMRRHLHSDVAELVENDGDLDEKDASLVDGLKYAVEIERRLRDVVGPHAHS